MIRVREAGGWRKEYSLSTWSVEGSGVVVVSIAGSRVVVGGGAGFSSSKNKAKSKTQSH